MNESDEIRKLQSEVLRLTERLARVERQIGKLPLRISVGASGTGSGGNEYFFVRPDESALIAVVPAVQVAIGLELEYLRLYYWSVDQWNALSHYRIPL